MFKEKYQQINSLILKHIILILAIIVFIIYNNKPKSLSFEEGRAARNFSNTKMMAVSNNIETTSNKYIENNFIELSVNNVEKTKQIIDLQLKKLNGILENLYSNKFYNKMSYSITYRVPNSELNNFIDFIKKQGKVKNQNFSISEVNDSINKNEKTLQNLQRRKSRLENLLKKSNNKAEDILKIEQQLNEVQEKIANYENILTDTTKDIKMSVVRLNIVPERYIIYPNGEEWNFKNKVNENIVNFILFSQKIINIILKLIIFSPYIALIYFIYKKINKFNIK